MFDEIKTLFRAAMKAFGERIAPLEDDVKAIKNDVAEFKTFMAEIRGGGLDDLKAEVDAFGAKPAVDAAPAASAAGDHPDHDMAAAGLPAAGPLPTAA